jgi:GAF domain-containing protein
MEENILIDRSLSKEEQYNNILPQIKALIDFETDIIANLANVAAVLKEAFEYPWVGFYILKGDELVLGPFQGQAACTRLTPGKGVCGTSFSSAASVIVPDVDQFPGHIACSSESRSEIVVPILKDGKVLAVIDLDSNELNDFNTVDQEFLEQLSILISARW